jgi:hypothetical protein
MTQFTYTIGPDTRISFPSKPVEAIRTMLKGAGFRWSPSAQCWWRRGCKGAADFITALNRELNPNRPDGACWRCQSPQGFFRPYGASTPVFCEHCHDVTRYWQSLSMAEQDHFKALSQSSELDAAELAWTNRSEHTCAGMHDVSCDACHADRFDLDYEDRCREACGL